MQNRNSPESTSGDISGASRGSENKRLKLGFESEEESYSDESYEKNNDEISSIESMRIISDEFNFSQPKVLSFSRSPSTSPTKQMIDSILQNPNYLKQLTDAIQHEKYTSEIFEKSVVKIECNSKNFSYKSPWRAATQATCSGSGFILNYQDHTFIISNAHVVSDFSHLSIRLADESTWYPATVELIDHDCDLSILSVSSIEFMSRIIPLELGELIGIRKKLTVLGFPIGGTELFVAEGTVSRIEVDTYCWSGLDLLQIQVTAAINAGNSGGPVLGEHNKVIGVAFQGVRGYEGLGYIIPSPILKHFLDDYLRSKFSRQPYQGFPDLNFNYQKLQSEEYRKALKLDTSEIGVRINHIAPLCSSFDIFKIDDILIELDGHAVKFDGTVKTEFHKRVHLNYLISSKHIGDTIDAKVIRNGEVVNLMVPLRYRTNTTALIDNIEHDKPPTYFIFCATVFVPVNADIMDDDELGNDLDEDIEGRDNKYKKFPGQELVMIKEMFECKYTTHQTICAGDLVARVNGEKVKNLRHLIHLIENSTGEYVMLTTNTKLTCALKRISEEQHNEILSKFVIHQDRSDDLLNPPIFKAGSPEYEEQLASSQLLRPTTFLL